MKRFSAVTQLALLVSTFCIGSWLVIEFRYYAGSPPNSDSEPVDSIPDKSQLTSKAAESPIPTPTLENTSLADKPPQYLCDHLADLQEMAWEGYGYSGDAVYDALKRNGYYSMPCLVDKITDMRPAKNPTGAPFWAGLTYRVGDTAVLMLMDINDMYWPKGMVPKDRERHFNGDGMFYYYFYVHEVPGGRKQVQKWWRNWLKTCQPECAIVPTLDEPN